MKESLRALIPENVSIPDGKLILAFSGGSDSLFLLIVLSLLAPDRTLAVYIDHGIRGRKELDAEIALNKANAERFGIPFIVEKVPENLIRENASRKGIGIEAAAREARYSLLFSAAREFGASYILTAHHREDQTETVIMRMLSSSPFYSYQGIRRKDGILYRPILTVPKREILSFLSQSGVSWAEDSTNNDTNYLRNKIRHLILPQLTEEERELISKIASNVDELKSRYPEIRTTQSFYIEADRNEFLSSPPFMREEFLYRSFHSLEIEDRISRKLLADISERAEMGSGRLSSSGVSLFFSKEKIRIYPALTDFVVEYNGKDISFCPLSLKHIAEDELTLRLDESKLLPPVIIRTSREGDRISLKGGVKRISELEKDMRIPYSIVMEDRNGIVAYFSRFLGGRDRIAKRFLEKDGRGIALAIGIDKSYIQKDESYGR